MDETKQSLSMNRRYNPNGWASIPITDATYEALIKCQGLFSEYGEDGQFHTWDHWLSLAMVKLTDYRHQELSGEWVLRSTLKYVKRRQIPQSVKKCVLERDGHKCTKCDATKKLHLHHIQMVSRGGTNEPDNLTTLCDDCHRLEHSRGA